MAEKDNEFYSALPSLCHQEFLLALSTWEQTSTEGDKPIQKLTQDFILSILTSVILLSKECVSVALYRCAKSCVVQRTQSKRHGERVGRATTGGAQQDWSVSVSVTHCGLLHTRQCFLSTWEWKWPVCSGVQTMLRSHMWGFEHIIYVSGPSPRAVVFTCSEVNHCVWVVSSASESFLWGPVSSVTSGMQSLLSKRRAAFTCSLAAEVKLPHGPIQFHAQLMLLKLMDLQEVILR